MRREHIKSKKIESLIMGIFLLLLFAIIACSFLLPGEIVALAAPVAHKRYVANGEWEVYNENGSLVESGEGVVFISGESICEVNVMPAQYSGDGLLERGVYLNWSTVQFFFSVNTNSYTVSPKKFIIKKEGTEVFSQTFGTSGPLLLDASSLETGSYEATLTITAVKKAGGKSYPIKLKYNFFVDVDIPVSKLFRGEDEIEDFASVNTSFNYLVEDQYFQNIFAKPPGGEWAVFFSPIYGVNPIAANNGLWQFQAEDLAGNTSSVSSVYLDSVTPEGVLKDENNQLKDEVVVNYPFRVFFTDNIEIKNIFVKAPTDSDYVDYPNGQLINSNPGLYQFYAIDVAGNQSEKMEIIFDNVKPTIQFFSGQLELIGQYTSSGSINALVEDKGGAGVYKAYVKRPGSSEFEEYVNRSEYVNEGLYVFYALDCAGNRSEDCQICLDRTAPKLKLFLNEGEEVLSLYLSSNKIYCIAEDEVSGLDSIYVKVEGANYIKYTNGSYIYTQGEVCFYAEDLAGNISSVKKITLDNIKPAGTIMVNGSQYDKNYVAQAFSYSSSDEGSGVERDEIFFNGSWRAYYGEEIEVSMPHTTYAFRTLDKAMNVSDEKTVILSMEAPTISILQEGSLLEGEYTNKNFTALGHSTAGAIVKYEIRYPNDSKWYVYTPSTLQVEPLRQGSYYFRCLDEKGLYSNEISVCVDTIKPEINAFVDGNNIEKKYVKGEVISLECIDLNPSFLYVLLPGSEKYQLVSENVSLYNHGLYKVYAVDIAGNESEVIEFVLDNSKKTIGLKDTFVENSDFYGAEEIELSGLVQFLVSKDPSLMFTYQVEDENIAPIESVYINFKKVEPGQQIHTVAGGVYNVEVIDCANNVANYIFTSSVPAFQYDPFYGIWYESNFLEYPDLEKYILDYQQLPSSHHAYVQYFNFATYESAYIYTKDCEESLVIKIDWHIDLDWELDSKDRINRVPGEAYLYRKESDFEEFVVFFTKERIDEVMQKYIEEVILKKDFISDTPRGENVDDIRVSKDVLTDQLRLSANLSYKVDNVPVNNLFNQHGSHKIFIYDEFDNVVNYDIFIVGEENKLEVEYLDISTNLMKVRQVEDVEYLSYPIRIKAQMELSPFIITKIYDENNNLEKMLINSDSYLLEKSGKYRVVSYNQGGNIKQVSIYISLDLQTLNFCETDYSLEINFQKSPNLHVSIHNISIYKDGKELEYDDAGVKITKSVLLYNFFTSGEYQCVFEDNFRKGSNAVTESIVFSLKEVSITILGIENDAYTNSQDLSIDQIDYGEIRVFLNEVLEEPFLSSYSFLKEGKYDIEAKNYDGTITSFSFNLDLTPPQILANGGEEGGFCEDVYLSFSEPVQVIVSLDGEEIAYDDSDALKDPGLYLVTAIDMAGNRGIVSFIIEKKILFQTTIPTGFLSNSMQITHIQETKYTISKNGERIENTANFESNDNNGLALKFEEAGKWEVVLYDEWQNIIKVNFEILPLVQKAAMYKIPVNFQIIKIEKLESTYKTQDLNTYVKRDEQNLQDYVLDIQTTGEYKVTVKEAGFGEYSFSLNILSAAPTVHLSGVNVGESARGAVKLSSLDLSGNFEVFFNEDLIMNGRYENSMFYVDADILPHLTFEDVGNYKIVTYDELGNSETFSFSIKEALNIKALVAYVLIGVVLLIIIVIIVVQKLRNRGE